MPFSIDSSSYDLIDCNGSLSLNGYSVGVSVSCSVPRNWERIYVPNFQENRTLENGIVTLLVSRNVSFLFRSLGQERIFVPSSWERERKYVPSPSNEKVNTISVPRRTELQRTEL